MSECNSIECKSIELNSIQLIIFLTFNLLSKNRDVILNRAKD